MATTVTSKGQASDGRVVLVKLDADRPTSRFEALRGRAGKSGLSTDEIMALTRGEA
ncbi:MAG: AbrB family transcriptional regulator [Alphaproteobacteria bacterium]|nr:AbrB family transcriptional regulator [Alphaproteobacteria bacterium]